MWTSANTVLFSKIISWMLTVWKIVELRYFDIEVQYIDFFVVIFVFCLDVFGLLLVFFCILFLFFKIRVGTVLCSLTVKHERTPAMKSIMIPCSNELVRSSALYSHADAAKRLTAVEVKDLWISQTRCAFLSHVLMMTFYTALKNLHARYWSIFNKTKAQRKRTQSISPYLAWNQNVMHGL